MSAQDMQSKPNELAPRMPKSLQQEAMMLFAVPSTKHDELSMALYIAMKMEELQLIYEIDNYSNILVTKGEGPYPCFCAHLDTVHMYHDGFNIRQAEDKYHTRNYLYAENNADKRVGIGGDDKCGVFACLYLLERIPNIKVVFFSSEESGGSGSNGIKTDFFKDCKFLGGIDRWNGTDFINKYACEYTFSKSFKKAIRPLLDRFGYDFNSGLFTDAFNVMDRKIGISCFNMSCGYYSHHSDQEYVDLNELYNCCLLCEELANLPDVYPHTFTSKVYSNNYLNSTWSSWKRPTYGGVNGDVYNPVTRCWEPKKDYTKNEPKDSTAPAIRRCAECNIELLEGEFYYCAMCIHKHRNNYDRRYDYYD